MSYDRPPAPPPRVSPDRGDVTYVERVATSDFTFPDNLSEAEAKRTVAAHRRERRGRRRWTIYNSQLPRLVSALEAAGYVVERTNTSTSSGRSARTP